MNLVTQRPSILIVDDNPTNIKVLMDYLSGEGYQIHVAEDGESALEQACYSRPDLILLDVMMPGIDGFETCTRLKQQSETRDTPVIFMTALADTPYILKGFAVGGVDYLTKPLQQDEVNVRVRTHISIRRLQRELLAEIETRKKAEEELREINAGKDRFFSIIAHDLKNPMQAVLVMSETLCEIMPKAPLSETLPMAKTIKANSERIGRLLLDLLNWAQIQLGKLEMQCDSHPLAQILDFNIALTNINAGEKNVAVQNNVTEPIDIYGDVRMIDTVLRNLLNNAVKFSPPHGVVKIDARIENKEVIITVSDSGVGIPADKIPTLFHLSTNHSTYGTSGEKGTGLGLPLCREMAEKNRGRIWAESTLGEGSRFCFTIPVAPKTIEELQELESKKTS